MINFLLFKLNKTTDSLIKDDQINTFMVKIINNEQLKKN